MITAPYSWHFEILALKLNKSYFVSFYLFNQVNTWLQIQTKVNELPLDTFPLVLFLQIELLIRRKLWLVHIKFRNNSLCAKHCTSTKIKSQQYLFFSSFTVRKSLLSAWAVNFHPSFAKLWTFCWKRNLSCTLYNPMEWILVGKLSFNLMKSAMLKA